jgi:ubiquinone/menaquinone biosynthesis C-methylase UbiE
VTLLTRLVLACVSAAALSAAASAQQQEHLRLFRPEDLGLLEPPDRDVWQRPEEIMDALQIAEGSVVADLGAGSGWFTIRLARRVLPTGKVYAEDIQQPMVSAMNLRIKREGLEKIVTTVLGTASDPRLPPNALDAVLIVDAYHEMEDPVVLLRHISRSLKRSGVVGIVNHTKRGFGPGPPMEERVDPDQVIRDAQAAGLRLKSQPDVLPYQYLLIFERADAPKQEQRQN